MNNEHTAFFVGLDTKKDTVWMTVKNNNEAEKFCIRTKSGQFVEVMDKVNNRLGGGVKHICLAGDPREAKAVVAIARMGHEVFYEKGETAYGYRITLMFTRCKDSENKKLNGDLLVKTDDFAETIKQIRLATVSQFKDLQLKDILVSIHFEEDKNKLPWHD